MYFERSKTKRTKTHLRGIVCMVLVVCILIVYAARLVQLQVVDYDEYNRQLQLQSAVSIPIKANRGEILDCYGREIAVNREGYNIAFDASRINLNRINNTIMRLVSLLKENGSEWRDKLPLTDTYPYKFKSDASNSEIATLKTELGVNNYADAMDCFRTMVEMFSLENYSYTNQRILAGIRYTMLLEDFSASIPYTFSEDIDDTTRAVILESSDEYSGVYIDEVAVREYKAGDIAAQIVGTMGPIYAEDWEELKEKGYSYSDYVGKTGIEAAFEDELRGEDGVMKLVTHADGTVEEVIEKEPVAGKTIMLTVDLEIQQVAKDSLEEAITQMLKDNTPVTSGAIVVENVNTGGIIAAVNYPNYTLDEYLNNYTELANDSSKPLFNRAFNGTYPPGSTFKAGVAAAALTTKILTADDTITCRQSYTYFKDQTFHCLDYHGSINVVTALSKSCNIFFYETGRRLGIDVMNSYCQLLGLGVKTGIELSESAGVIAGPAYAKSIGTVWNPGDTVQAAIGQSYNLFTPLQLATYTATLANGGTRYKAHLLQEIKSYDLTETVQEQKTEIAANTGLSEYAITTVKAGMRSVAFEGTASSTFRNYQLEVGGKTGTAQTYTGNDNGLFVSFAPYQNSEISVAIVVEGGPKGYLCASAVKNIYNAYFFTETNKATHQNTDELLS